MDGRDTTMLHQVPISGFVEMLLAIFSSEYAQLKVDMLNETMKWASEGYLVQ